jgi:uncharacterized damage-inducible protein DinB
MTPTLCLVLAEYNHWMNQRMYDAAAKLSDDQLFADRRAFFGSLFNTLNHIAVGDLIWLHRFALSGQFGELTAAMTNLAVPTSLTQPVATTLADLRALRIEVDQAILGLAKTVTAEQLAQTLQYANTSGKKQAKNFGLLLLHLFNHQTHHRGQVSTLLFQAGIDVGVTDLNALIVNEA